MSFVSAPFHQLCAIFGAITFFQWMFIFIVLVFYIYWSLTKNYGKFEKQGLFSIPPQILFGNSKDLFLQTKPMIDFYRDIYNQFGNNKCGIFYEGPTANFFVKDPELIKQVLIKDFDHFVDLNFIPKELANLPMNEFGLANALGDEWRALKSSITPAFSLKNIKNIGTNINGPALDVIDCLKKSPNGIADLELYSGYFAMDCIGRIVFSMDFQTAKSGGNEFVKYGDGFFESWRFMVASVLPSAAKHLNIAVFNPKSSGFFLRLAHQVLSGRDGANSYPSDVLGLMMKIRDGKLIPEVDDDKGSKQAMAAKCMDNDMICRTLMQFFMDGYDTVSAMTTMCFFFVAHHPEVQDRLINEVDELAGRVGANITGDDVKDLPYMAQVYNETSRLAPFSFTVRRCTKPWKVPGTNAMIPVDMGVVIPIVGLHYDSAHFPEPEKFDPDRFSPENKHKITSGTFLPFGMGPRECIGMKIAQMEAKILMYQVLRNFRLEPCETTVYPPQWRNDHFNRIQGGCHLKLIPRI
uniref:Cytochrome P450 CYP3024A3 n=2 Tax=Tigriopus japonicus TaxID=158387 RepID=A0A088DIA2_TIGJA|nr:cytochrome P450 CYP3024A3 [Tigriopus japonicus]